MPFPIALLWHVLYFRKSSLTQIQKCQFLLLWNVSVQMWFMYTTCSFYFILQGQQSIAIDALCAHTDLQYFGTNGTFLLVIEPNHLNRQIGWKTTNFWLEENTTKLSKLATYSWMQDTISNLCEYLLIHWMSMSKSC